jgi:uncharacterized protein (DUF2062 family)
MFDRLHVDRVGGRTLEPYQFLNTVVGAVALLLLCSGVVRVAIAALRRRRAGLTGALVGAGVTSQLIGFGLAVAAAVGGGYITFSALQPIGLLPLATLVAQVLAAFLTSWIIGRLYAAWLAQPVYRWFAGEEAAGHDR